jgi:uncharacterized protein
VQRRDSPRHREWCRRISPPEHILMAKLLKRLLSGTLIILLSAYVMLSPRVSPQLYKDRLLRPQVGRGGSSYFPPLPSIVDRQVWFSAKDGSKLHGRMFQNVHGKRIVLYNIGSAGDIPQRLPYVHTLLESGESVFIYEYRGFGISRGDAKEIKDICDDGLSAFDYLTTTEHYQPKNIIVLGESLGSGVATYISTKRPVAGIILQSGLYSLERTSKNFVPALRMYPSLFYPRPQLNNAAILRRDHAPLLILHGEQDDLINIRDAADLYRDVKGPKTFVRFPHSDHYGLNPKDHDIFRSAIDGFLSSLP